MIEWGNFAAVAIGALVGGCAVVALFSTGLRLAGTGTQGRMRVVGIVCFVVCALVAAVGVCLVVPYFSGFFASL